MSFLKIKDPKRRDKVVADFIKTKETIRKNTLNEKVGEQQSLRDLANYFKPVTDSQKEIVDVLRPVADRTNRVADDLKRVIGNDVFDDLGPVARQYLIKAFTPGEHDTVYGIYDANDTLMLGNTRFDVDGDDIVVKGKRYPGTPGLWSLIVNKNPTSYTTDDLVNYSRLMTDSGSLWEDNDTSSSFPKDTTSVKWNRFLKDAWDVAQYGGGDDDDKSESFRLLFSPSSVESLPFSMSDDPLSIPSSGAEDEQVLLQAIEKRDQQKELENRLLTEEVINTVQNLKANRKKNKEAFKTTVSVYNTYDKSLKQILDNPSSIESYKEVAQASQKVLREDIGPNIERRMKLINLLAKGKSIPGAAGQLKKLEKEMETLNLYEGIIRSYHNEARRRVIQLVSHKSPSKASTSKGKGGFNDNNTVFLPSDPIALTDRLVLLLQSNKAGNIGVRNEIVSIADILLKHRFLPMSTYKTIMASIN